MQSSVLVTGASSGIGCAICKRLTEKGIFVFAGIKTLSKSEDFKGVITQTKNFATIHLDVTEEDSIIKAVEKINETLREKNLIFSGVVNNAADENLGPVEILPVEVFRHEMEVGYLGTVAVSKAFIPLLRKYRGRIINISSMNGRFSFKNHSTSCATKYAVEAFSDSLRMELKRWGVHVVIVEPGLVDTDLMKGKTINEFKVKIPRYKGNKAFDLYFPNHEKTVQNVEEYVRDAENHPKNAWQKLSLLMRGQWWLLAPDDIAKIVEKGLCKKRPKTRYLVGIQANWWYFLRCILADRWFDYFVAEHEFDF
ncbi:SDR family NAD(P)-dependent oxidoreductase [Candidatus Uabimicrobium sp. HlEnr_7]|uniref:SDR family NAD(P)-dependent oxidoreductase n=1 Tax=Candidatus Uabimicrobium helgolandensis TaxID=3095367 RepID=UPI003556C00D